MIELAHEDGTRFIIPVKYFTEDIEKLEYINGKSDWIDLRAAKDTVIQKGEFCLIHLGIAMQLPKGFEAHIVPRSVLLRTLVLFRPMVLESSITPIVVTMTNG